MNCDMVKKMLPFLDDGSISEETVDEIKKHLEYCPACMEEYKEQTDVVALVKGALKVRNFPSDEAFIQAIESGLKKRGKHIRSYRWILSSAAMFFVVVGAALLFRVYTVNDSVPLKSVANSSIDFYKYVADNYLDSHDLLEVVDVSYMNDSVNINVSENPYVDVSFDDIVLNVDEKDLNSYINKER